MIVIAVFVGGIWSIGWFLGIGWLWALLLTVAFFFVQAVVRAVVRGLIEGWRIGRSR